MMSTVAAAGEFLSASIVVKVKPSCKMDKSSALS